MSSENASEEAKDPIDAALIAFRKAWHSGENPDPKLFCQSYPECGPELLDRINNFLLIAEGLESPASIGDKGMAEEELASNKILGDFRIIRELGRGGMGTVYEAEQISLKRKVALKVLPSHLSFSDDAVQKFHREAEAGGRQSHPVIVSIHAIGEHEGTHYIAQELVEDGITLHDKLKGLRQEGEQPPGYFRKAASLISEVADALQHAHVSGVIHRDIKPSNILLSGEWNPKVTDFGLARVEDALALSRTGDFAGTPYYMSPEQAMSKRVGIDKRTDIYSLGVTLYEMLTLRRPFDGQTSHEILKKIMLMDPLDPHKANPKVPRDLSVICLKAMEKLPAKRYQSMEEFGDDLGRYLRGDAVLAKPAGPMTRALKRFKRNPALSVAVGIAVAAVLALVVSVPWYVIGLNRLVNELAVQKQEAIDQRTVAEQEADRAAAAERRALSVSVIPLTEELKRAAREDLWPRRPEKVIEMDKWLVRAREMVSMLPTYREDLAALRKEGTETEDGRWEFDDRQSRWLHGQLEHMMDALEGFVRAETGLIAEISERRAAAAIIKQHTIDDYSDEWAWAIEEIAESPHYAGLELEPQIGLVPLEPDPDSELWEFWVWETGEKPRRDEETGHWIITGETGVVLVLLPGGTFWMGASSDPSSPHNYDEGAASDEAPVHEVRLEPFFLSKYELTQGQWLRIMGEPNPSWCQGDHFVLDHSRPLAHPVEEVDWRMSEQVCARAGLVLPTEAQWEYGCRAGTKTVYYTGNEVASLTGFANIADEGSRGSWVKGWNYEPGFSDGWKGHAPVGSLLANEFGLHDMHGNVWEWCRDWYGSYRLGHGEGDGQLLVPEGGPRIRINRGGGFFSIAMRARSAARACGALETRVNSLGLRAAVGITAK